MTASNSLWDQLKDFDPIELRELQERLQRRRDEPDSGGTAGVREPRRPGPPSDETGAIEKHDYETEGLGGT